MGDPILWTGFVMAAGLAGAALTRSLRGPAATGALLAGLLLGWAVSEAGSSVRPADLDLLRDLGIALLGFLAGAELDLGDLMRRGHRIAGRSLAQALTVALLAGLSGLALGLQAPAAAALGAAAAAASPIAILAVAAEGRARGQLTQRLLGLSSISLLVASAVVGLAFGAAGWTLRLAIGLVMAAACGLLISMPLSRMAARGAILACAGLGLVLIAGVAAVVDASGSMLPVVSIVAGLLACSIIPTRTLVLEALRDLAFPCVIGLFAISGCAGEPFAWPRALAAAPLLLAARAAGLVAVETIAGGASRRSVREAMAQLPMTGLGAAGPAAILLAGGPGLAPAGSILVAASVLSHVIGMPATHWALRRSGEVAHPDREPDAWRAAMR